MINGFKHKWGIKDPAQDKLLRGLCHKDLRYVLQSFDGSAALEDVVTEAKDFTPEEVHKTEVAA